MLCRGHVPRSGKVNPGSIKTGNARKSAPMPWSGGGDGEDFMI